MNVKIESALNSTSEIIESSSIDAPTKVFYQNLIGSAAEGTNGLSNDQKLQSVSETCFYLTEVFVRRDIVNHERFATIENKIDGLSDKIDILTAKMEAQPQKRSRLEIIMTSLSNIPWWWAAALTAIVGILAYGDHIMDVLNRIM